MTRRAEEATRFDLKTGKNLETVTIEVSFIANRAYLSILGEKLVKHYMMPHEAWERLTATKRKEHDG